MAETRTGFPSVHRLNKPPCMPSRTKMSLSNSGRVSGSFLEPSLRAVPVVETESLYAHVVGRGYPVGSLSPQSG
jgi:hypothetical protein